MTHDIHTLQAWIRIVVLIAAFCTNSVPVIYATFPWRARPIGRLFMYQALSLSMAMDLTALFSYWKPKDVLVVFWVDALVITLIAATSLMMAIFMLKIRFTRRD